MGGFFRARQAGGSRQVGKSRRELTRVNEGALPAGLPAPAHGGSKRRGSLDAARGALQEGMGDPALVRRRRRPAAAILTSITLPTARPPRFNGHPRPFQPRGGSTMKSARPCSRAAGGEASSFAATEAAGPQQGSAASAAWPAAAASALLTDLYQLTMLQAYFDQGMNGRAVFELFSRRLPAGRNFLLAAGLEQVLQWLEALRFGDEEIGWLAGTGRFTPAFLRSLRDLRFTGDVWALPEGTACFADEPLLRISAPLREAQLVESRVLNLLHFQTVVASKAARCVLAAPGKLLVDFGLRRAHGAEAGLLSARASYLAGFDGTATVLAAMLFGIPAYGTMAHSFVQAHEDERLAFAHFARSQPRHATLLIDTYDTEAAARELVALAREGVPVQGVRIDSGDLAAHARAVRAILDAGGLAHATLFASGNLDEHRLAGLLRAGAPIDGFGVGTRMNTSADAPFLDCAYKLVAYDGRPCRKRSEGKATWPGAKQVWRRLDEAGRLAGDVLGLEGEPQEGMPLLEPAMLGGHRTGPAPSLAAIRAHAQAQLAALPPALRSLAQAAPHPVLVSQRLRDLAASLDAHLPDPRLRLAARDVEPATREEASPRPACPPDAAAAAAVLPRWEHFDHGADIGVRGLGRTRAEAYEQAALALTAVITEPARVEPLETVEIRCQADDDEALLVAWLNAIVTEMAARRMLFGRFQVELEGLSLHGEASGEAVSVGRHEPAVEVKGATYTQLRVRPAPGGGWLAQTVVDV